jgi:hypothetical protein
MQLDRCFPALPVCRQSEAFMDGSQSLLISCSVDPSAGGSQRRWIPAPVDPSAADGGWPGGLRFDCCCGQEAIHLSWLAIADRFGGSQDRWCRDSPSDRSNTPIWSARIVGERRFDLWDFGRLLFWIRSKRHGEPRDDRRAGACPG